MKYRPLVVVAEMAGPLVLRDPIHLDGLLLAAREKRDGMGARGAPFTALSRCGEVYAASAGVLVAEGIGGILEDVVTRTKRLDMKRDGPYIRLPENAKKEDRVIGPMSPYRSEMRKERVLGNVRQVVWQALGDAAEIEDLLSYVTCIGKQYATGWGEVAEFSALPSEADPKLCGLAIGGKASRNLPVGMLEALGLQSDIVVKGRVEPPYAMLDGTVDIAAPSLRNLIMTEEEVREAFVY
ncbi:hypothetical protein ACVIGB_001120 [Bradyrhizobium sp. USDA 4341]